MSEWGEEPKFFCPLCGAPDEELTYHVYYDRLIRRNVASVYCNQCGKASLVIEVLEESEQMMKVKQHVEKLIAEVEAFLADMEKGDSE